MQVSFYTCLESYFKKQIFSCILLRRRFFVWQLGFMYLSGSARGLSGIPVYPKKIRQNTQNSSKYTPNYTQVYCIPETDIPNTRI